MHEIAMGRLRHVNDSLELLNMSHNNDPTDRFLRLKLALRKAKEALQASPSSY